MSFIFFRLRCSINLWLFLLVSSDGAGSFALTCHSLSCQKAYFRFFLFSGKLGELLFELSCVSLSNGFELIRVRCVRTKCDNCYKGASSFVDLEKFVLLCSCSKAFAQAMSREC